MTTELIKVTTGEEGKRLVSARELHEFLEIGTRFDKWIPRMIDYGFEENIDYIVTDIFVPNSNGGKQNKKDYILSIDMAKELSMIQRTEKGKEARQYFIQCEKQLKEIDNKANLLLSIYNGGQEGILASKKLTEIEVKEATAPLILKIEEDKPLVDFSNQILKSSDNILIRELAKIISDEVLMIGQNRLYEKLREWKMIFKNSTEPYQTYVENGYFVLEEKSVRTTYGTKLAKTTKVTPRGQIAIVEKFRKEVLQEMDSFPITF